jgi:hypothetical protein
MGGDERCQEGNRKLLLKIIEAVSCVATASPLLFDFLQPSGMWFVGYRSRRV